MNNLNQILFIIISAVLGGLCGYFVGVAKTFREEKQKAYEEILPVVLKVAYNPEQKDEEGFGKALSKLWLYGSKAVANKMDDAVSILHDPKRGNIYRSPSRGNCRDETRYTNITMAKNRT